MFMTNNDHNLLKITLLQTFEGLTFTFPYLLPLLVHRPSKCRPLNIQWTTIGCILLTFSCMEEASLPVGWGCSGTTGQGKGCEDDLDKVAAFKTSCLWCILFYTAWVFAAFGPSCRLGPKLRFWCFHFRLKRDRRPPNLPFRCSDMHKFPPPPHLTSFHPPHLTCAHDDLLHPC